MYQPWMMNIGPILQRGLLGYMDEQDRPQGLLGLVEDDAPGAIDDETIAAQVGNATRQPRSMQDMLDRSVAAALQIESARRSTADFLGRILANPGGIAPPTYDPVTGVPNVSRYLEDIGRLFSANAPALPGLPGARPPGPTASAPVTSARPVRLPWTWPSPGDYVDTEEPSYAVRHIGDEDFGPVWEADTWDEAVELLKREERGEVRGRVRHEEIGGIAVPWGVPGSGRGDGYGLSKLLRFHPEVVADLPDKLRDMRIATRTQNRFRLENDSHYAVISRNYQDRTREPWILSAYVKK